jgi:ribosomal protein L37AE/L43A
MMNNKDGLDKGDAGIIHFHVCIHCGQPRKREDIDGREVTSGILHCSKCGLDGPLNIEVGEYPGA